MATTRLAPVTVAPLWMVSVPLVPAVLAATSTEIEPNAPVLLLLKVRLPVLPSCPITSGPPPKLDPLPSTVAVPSPEVPMLIWPEPLETAPPAVMFIVLPPLTVSVEVVVNVEPAPMTAIVEAVLFANVPVMVASPPFWIVSVLPAATVTVAPLARVSWRAVERVFSLKFNNARAVDRDAGVGIERVGRTVGHGIHRARADREIEIPARVVGDQVIVPAPFLVTAAEAAEVFERKPRPRRRAKARCCRWSR